MATSFKPISDRDIITTRTLLHEAIPISGTHISGTYGQTATSTEFPTENNIKNYSHGLYQSVYDFAFLSSSANHLFDITVVYSTGSVWVHSRNTTNGVVSHDSMPAGTNIQNDKKVDIYNQMAQVLVGHDTTGSIKEFQIPGGNKIREAYFINFSRLLIKDEIKKGSLTMSMTTASSFTVVAEDNSSARTIHDHGDTTYYSDSPAGEYAILTMSANPPGPEHGGKPVGLVYYQAGIVVLSASMFFPYDSSQVSTGHDTDNYLNITGSGNGLSKDDDNLNFRHLMVSSSITGTTNALRHRIDNIEFQNTTELNSTIHFCRLNHNEFNYSSNPTYLSSSKIQVRGQGAGGVQRASSVGPPVAYITTIGLYAPDNALLAVAKLSKAVRKSPEDEITFRVRLDY